MKGMLRQLFCFASVKFCGDHRTVVGANEGHAQTTLLFCISQILWRSLDCHNIQVIMTAISFEDIVAFKGVVSVILWLCGCRAKVII